jgi:geranylgeranyl pyrophosphate synthase
VEGIDQQTASIYAPVQHLLEQVEERLDSMTRSHTPFLGPLLDYVLAKGGKRIRPAITLLAAEFYSKDPENPVTMASAVELLHLATLIHDDTVDNSDMRRGKATVTSLWGPHVAVLFGDYVFATAATFVCDTGNVRVIRRFSETIMDLASGELVEYFNAFDAQQARDVYHDRIYRKTASLFCTAAETGAVLGGAPEKHVQVLRDYAYKIGMAYQMVDDLLDVRGDAVKLGKPVGNDLLQGVMTLPTIMLMERYPDDNLICELFKDRGPDGLFPPDGKVSRTMEMINNSTIVEDCYEVIRGYCDDARLALEALPDCEARGSLMVLADYIWERSH